MIYVGIDPGLSGGIAVLRDGAVSAYDMPVLSYGKQGKHRGDWRKLADLIKGAVIGSPAKVILEHVGAMPGQGTVSMFAFGGAFHGAWAVCECLGLNVQLVLPRTWKAHFNLTADKKESQELARKLFPDVDLSLAKYNGRAEALLIAQWGKDFYGRR